MSLINLLQELSENLKKNSEIVNKLLEILDSNPKKQEVPKYRENNLEAISDILENNFSKATSDILENDFNETTSDILENDFNENQAAKLMENAIEEMYNDELDPITARRIQYHIENNTYTGNVEKIDADLLLDLIQEAKQESSRKDAPDNYNSPKLTALSKYSDKNQNRILRMIYDEAKLNVNKSNNDLEDEYKLCETDPKFEELVSIEADRLLEIWNKEQLSMKAMHA